MFVIPWKVQLLICDRLGTPCTHTIYHETDKIRLTLGWKLWGVEKQIVLIFTERGVEWDNRKDTHIRFFYPYEKMEHRDGIPLLTVNVSLEIEKVNPPPLGFVTYTVELFSKPQYEQLLLGELTKIPDFSE